MLFIGAAPLQQWVMMTPSLPPPLSGHACSLQLLETCNLFEENADKYQKAWGLSRVEEVVYIIQKRS